MASGSDRIFSQRVVDHTVQGILIFASVFLAFWLNDYRRGVIEDRATAAAVQAVANEIAQNRGVLERWAPYHGEISRDLEARLQQGTEGLTVFQPQEFLDERGIFREILTYDSWDYIRQSDIRLGLDARLAINRIFRQQEYVDGAIRSVVDFLGSREVFDDALAEENHVIFYNLITDLYFQQLALLENYDRVLEELEPV